MFDQVNSLTTATVLGQDWQNQPMTELRARAHQHRLKGMLVQCDYVEGHELFIIKYLDEDPQHLSAVGWEYAKSSEW